MHSAKITHFDFSYPGSDQPIIQNLNLHLQSQPAPTRAALIANNGVGKTTILNQIWQAGHNQSPKVRLSDKRCYFTQHLSQIDLNPVNFQQNFYELSLLSMEYPANTQDPAYHIWEWLAEKAAQPINDFTYQIGSNLVAFGINPNSLPNSFGLLSPGTRKKLLLSSLLATKPDLILADELTNHLDKPAIQTLISLVLKSPAAWIIVDHNRDFLKAVANRFVFIPDNKERHPWYFEGSFEKFEDELQQTLDKQQQMYGQLKSRHKALQEQQKELQQLANQYSESTQIGKRKAANARKLNNLAQDPLLSNLDLRKQVRFQRLPQSGKSKSNLLAACNPQDPIQLKIGRDISYTYRDFGVYQGQRLRILGPNGSGKSSILSCLMHQLNQQSLTDFPQWIGGQWNIPNLRLAEVFSLSQVTDYPPALAMDSYLLSQTKLSTYQLQSFLNRLELSKFTPNSKLEELSLGESIRLQLGILSHKAGQSDLKLIILDEPGNYLDVFTQRALIDLLHQYKQSLLLVTHDDDLAHKIGYQDEYQIQIN